MKKVALLLSLSVLFLYGCSQESDSISESETQNLTITNNLKANGNGSSASGHGTVITSVYGGDDEDKRQFSFHAREDRNGNVRGNGVLTKNGGVLNARFDIDCIIVDGNTAIMSGVITYDSGAQFEGWRCWFSVIDNGEGSNADQDEMTRLWVADWDELNCDFDFNPDFYANIGGNVQVRE